MDLVDWITLGIALYGAIIASIVGFQEVTLKSMKKGKES